MKEDTQLNPFNRILKIEQNFIDLFSNVTRLHDRDSIIATWNSLSFEIIPDITALANFSKIIYLRYDDERQKDNPNEEKNSVNPIHQKITNIIELELFFSMLIKIYSLNLEDSEIDISNNPIVASENHLDFIFSLFFRDDVLNESLNSISQFMSKVREVNQKQRLLQILSQQKNEISSYQEGELYEVEGSFYTDSLGPFFHELSTNWWYDDVVAEYIIYKKGYQRYEEVLYQWQNIEKTNISNKLDHISLAKLPLSHAKSDYNLIKIFYQLAVNAAEDGLHKIAIKYFNQIEEICLEILERIDISINQETVIIKIKVKKIFEKIKLLRGITQLTVTYKDLREQLNSNDIKKIEQTIIQGNSYLEDINVQLDLKYISAIPQVFNAIIISSLLMVKLKLPHSEIQNQIEDFLNKFCQRITIAVDQIVNEWKLLQPDKDEIFLKQKINKFLDDMILLHEVTAILPNSLKPKNLLIQRIKCIVSICKSVLFELKALDTNEQNKLLELIYKSKAFFYAQQADSYIDLLDENTIPLGRIKIHFSGSFISAHTIQMHLYQLTSQFLCLSEILPALFLAISQDPTIFSNKEEAFEKIKKTENIFVEFIHMLSQIQRDCETLLDHKEKHGKIVANVKWKQIIIRKTLVEAILLFFESIFNIILTQWASRLGLFDQAQLCIDISQKNAFTAVHLLEDPEYGEEMNIFAKHIFSFSQFCQENQIKISEQKEILVPAQPLFKLFRDMVFSI